MPGKVFSPSAMIDWVRCPIYRREKKLREPIDQEWEPNKLLGIAVNEALSDYWRQVRRFKLGGPGAMVDQPTPEVGLSRALETLRNGFQESEKWSLAGLEKMLTRSFQEALKEDVISAGTIISVDETLGISRPDLVQVTKTQTLVITDVKFTLRLNQEYQVKRLTEYETDDQWLHYDWEAREHFGFSPEWNRVLLIVGSPKPRAILHPWRTSDIQVDFWLPGAEQNWKDMEAEERGDRPVIPRFSSCHGKFGRCVYHGWCFDRASMGQFYREIPPRGDSPSDP